MLKMKLIWFAIAGLLLFATWAWATPPQDYTLNCSFKNPDGTVFRIIKYNLCDGNKFRIDYLSGDGAANTVEIYRKDKGLLWTLDPVFKNYTQVVLKQDAWDQAISGIFAAESQKIKKTGKTKYLNYSCDMYEAERSGWTTISVVEPAMNIIFRSELKEKDKTVQIMEATEFRLGKPAASLFEIPDGYKQNE